MKIKYALLISFLLALNLASSRALVIMEKAKVDLDGNNCSESISISDLTDDGGFVLKVNDVSVKGKLSDKVDGFVIVDIDKNDKYKEIAVHTPGPSDDDEYQIYWYDGKSLKNMGKLSRWPKFLGDGTVLVGDWMGFWVKSEKYILNQRKRTLQLLPQEFYFVNVKAKVKDKFPIYKTKNGREVVEEVKPNDNILILLCDLSSKSYRDQNYLIKTQTNLCGWAKLESFQDKVEGLPWAD